MGRISDKLKYNKLTYILSCKKLNISFELLDFLLERISDSYCGQEIKDILDMIKTSKNKEDFNNRIISYCKTQEKLFYTNYFLLGIVTGKYTFSSILIKDYDYANYDNLKNVDSVIIEKLKDKFYDYIMSDNSLKNEFLIDKNGNKDLTMDLDRNFCNQVLLDVLDPLLIKKLDVKSTCKKIAYEYIISALVYYREDILDNFDFILYDINNFDRENILERKEEYKKRKNLSIEQIKKTDDLGLLRNRLQMINNEKAKELLDRLDNIKDKEIENILEIEDIYLEYEILFREDLISKLYVPTENYTLIDNFQDVKTQLVHVLLRDPERHRKYYEEKLKKEIIAERTNKNDSDELTEEELNLYNKRKNLLDKQIDFTQVNYFINNSDLVYTDSIGIDSYKSDTSNQIATSYFSPANFIRSYGFGFMGIGFNKEGLSLESIALSSKDYITSNKGLNNLSIDPDSEFECLSNSSEDIESSNYKSELILFRRGIDSDTKASYLFVIVSSLKSDVKESEKILEKAIEISKKNNLKLVVYDIYKIRKSYEASLKEENKESKVENITKGNNL